MLSNQKDNLADQLSNVVESLGYEPISAEWRNLPFFGAWGLATSIAYRLASQELEGVELDKRERSNIARERAPQIAQQIAEAMQSADVVGRCEAEGAYVNCYFDVPGLAAQLLGEVEKDGSNYGRGSSKPARIMVEYSQPNTHKAFHVGHLRNVCLGHSLALILDFAGFETITANYIGDIGMHVIKCLWCYSRFHKGQEPEQDRGKWLGQVYTEADQRVNIREQLIGLVHDANDLPGFRAVLHSWADAHLTSPSKEQLLYGLDPGWQKVMDDLKAGFESVSKEPEESSTETATGPISVADSLVVQEGLPGREGPGAAEGMFDSLASSVTVKGVGADQYHQLLEALVAGKTLGAALTAVCQIVDEDDVAGAVRKYVPDLWLELGRWMRHQSSLFGTGSEKGSGVWTPEQLEALSDLLELYHMLDDRMEWWPKVDKWTKEIKELFARWDAQDPEVLALWETTREWSMEEFREIYEFLGAEFEIWFYESQVEEEGKEIVGEMVEEGLAQDLRPDGPVLMHIDDLLGIQKYARDGRPIGEYRTLLILRSDGTSLYSTKDLALARRKFEEYGVDRSVYVVDVRQAFYFKQVFKALELWGFEQARDCYHLAYEIVTDPAGTMSSRAGNVIPFEDFAQTALSRALAIVRAKNPTLENDQKQEVARMVGLGAMKYPMLSVDDDKVITFDLEQALSFQGQSSPYIQYAHARACRIVEKAGVVSDVVPDYSYLSMPTGSQPKSELMAEINLLEKIGDFPEVVQKAAVGYRPLVVATYVFELASLFTDFYQKCDVLRGGVPDGVRAARLVLVRAAKQTLANGLALLGIEAPEVM